MTRENKKEKPVSAQQGDAGADGTGEFAVWATFTTLWLLVAVVSDWATFRAIFWNQSDVS